MDVCAYERADLLMRNRFCCCSSKNRKERQLLLITTDTAAGRIIWDFIKRVAGIYFCRPNYYSIKIIL